MNTASPTGDNINFGVLEQRLKLLENDSKKVQKFSTNISRACQNYTQTRSNSVLGEVPYWIYRIEDYLLILRAEVRSMDRLISQKGNYSPQVAKLVKTISEMKTKSEKNLFKLHELIKCTVEKTQKPEVKQEISPNSGDLEKQISQLAIFIKEIKNTLEQSAPSQGLLIILQNQYRSYDRKLSSLFVEIKGVLAQIKTKNDQIRMMLEQMKVSRDEKLNHEMEKQINQIKQRNSELISKLKAFEQQKLSLIEKGSSEDKVLQDLLYHPFLSSLARDNLQVQQGILSDLLKTKKSELLQFSNQVYCQIGMDRLTLITQS